MCHRDPRLEGDSDTARVMRFADLEEVDRSAADLTAVLKVCCRWKDQ